MNSRLRECGHFHQIAKCIFSTLIVLCIVYPATRSSDHAIQYTSSSNKPQSSIDIETVQIDSGVPPNDFSSTAVKLRLLEPVFRRHIRLCSPKDYNCHYKSREQEEASGSPLESDDIASATISRDEEPYDDCMYWRNGQCIHTDPKLHEQGPCIVRSYGGCATQDSVTLTRSKGNCVQRAFSYSTLSKRQTMNLDESGSEAKTQVICALWDSDDWKVCLWQDLNALEEGRCMKWSKQLKCLQRRHPQHNPPLQMELQVQDCNIGSFGEYSDQAPPPILPPILPFVPPPALDPRGDDSDVRRYGKCTSWSEGECVHKKLVSNTMTSEMEDPSTLVNILLSSFSTASSYTSSSTQIDDMPEVEPGDSNRNIGDEWHDPECPSRWSSPKCLWKANAGIGHYLIITASVLISIASIGMMIFWVRKKYLRRTRRLVPWKAVMVKSPSLETARPEMAMPTYNEMTLASDMNPPGPQPSTKPATLVDSALPYKLNGYKNLDGSTDGWTKWIHKKIEDDKKSGLLERSWSPTPHRQQESHPPRVPTLKLPQPVLTTVRKTSGLPLEPKMLTGCTDSKGKGRERTGRIHWDSHV